MAEQQPPVSGSDPVPDPVENSTPAANAADVAALDAVVADGGVVTHVPDSAETPPPHDDQAAIDALLNQANFDDAAAVVQQEAHAETAPLDLPNFQQVMRDAQVSSIDLLRDVELNVKIELGRSRMLVEEVLKLGEGSVVELDKLAGDPVDLFVNDRLVARGEVLVLNDNFCVRVNEIVAGVKEEGL